MPMSSWSDPRGDIIDVASSAMTSPPENILEIGVYRCSSLMSLATAFPDSRIVCVDAIKGLANSEYVLKEWDGFLKQRASKNVTMIIGHSSDVVPMIDMMWDLVHIDGGHAYEQAKSDYEACLPKLNPGAVVMFDDIHDPNVARFFDELPSESTTKCGNYGVMVHR